jgi:branched-chain amino acid transport system substrate-binding protein
LIHASPSTTLREIVATDLAIADFQDYLAILGIDFEITILEEGAEESAVKAKEKFDTLAAKGVKYVLGVRWSSHAMACLEAANEQKILMISYASTSPLLMIPDDYLFRMPVTDVTQGPAVSKMLTTYGEGIDAVAVIQRADTWGDGLYDAIEENYVAAGGKIVDRMRYDPMKTEFAAEAAILDGIVSDGIAEYGQEHFAVLYIGFETDGVGLIAAAAGHPTLAGTQWFGTDGHVRSDKMVWENADLMLNTRQISTFMSWTFSDIFYEFAEKFYDRMGYQPSAYDTLAYDATYMLLMTMLDTASTDSETVKNALPTVGERYFGVSGWCRFNDDGDRKASNFFIWGMVTPEESQDAAALYPDPNEIGWEIIAIYDPISDSINWQMSTPLP